MNRPVAGDEQDPGRQAARLEALNRVGSALLRAPDLNCLFTDALDAVVAVTEADIAELFLLDEGDGGGRLARRALRPSLGEPLEAVLPVGSSLVGQALRTGMPVSSSDIAVDPRYIRQEEARRLGCRALLAVPLLAAGRGVGVLTLLRRRAGSYARQEVDLATTLAAQVATAVQNARLYEESAHRNRQLATLHDAAVALTSELALDQLLDRIVEAARRLVGAAYAAMRLTDPGGGGDRFAFAGLGQDERERMGAPPSGTRGVLGVVARGRSALRLADLTAHPAFHGFPPEHPCMRSFLGMPLTVGDEVLGTLYVTEKQGAPTFTAADEQALAALGGLAAIAVHNARLFAQLRQGAERLQAANAELERANRAKSAFLASMSHELRTPLNVVLGFAELLLDEMAALDAAIRREYVANIHGAGRQLLGLIQDILDLSKVEAGRMELRPEPVDVEAAVTAALDMLGPLAADKDISLTRGNGANGVIFADAAKFRQILYNLLSNALKFTPEGGRVTIDAMLQGDAVRVTVTDTGPGVAPGDRERIFGEFEQVHAPGQRLQGTGLGLALARRFVELHGGRIWVESGEHGGSRFVFTLPVARPVRDGGAPPGPAPAVSAGDSTPLVLVVEDDPQAAHLLCHTLERGGYRTVVAADGASALAWARELRPVAITLDVLLPGLDGWEVMRELKASAETGDIPVLVVSVVDDEQLGYALGANDYLVKPVDGRVLLQRLARYTLAAEAKAHPAGVLVIDGDPEARRNARAVLAPAGFQVMEAGSGKHSAKCVPSH